MFLTYVLDHIRTVKLALHYGLISREEAIADIDSLAKKYAELHKDIEVALNELHAFKRELESKQ
jgi:hypothetical protein